ncbi:hypothetical protein OHB12_20500 [Nocardia sp. NBC_01730]|uniref:hypothetical protein n=1 Tax=Nocardia sp. NBC_01730 TaxID=2975998 RepID=UPI002E0DF5E1|nr:hypothetical protein OHB12_20500 [Nocardia sp. NBC_01730]
MGTSVAVFRRHVVRRTTVLTGIAPVVVIVSATAVVVALRHGPTEGSACLDGDAGSAAR